MNFRHIRLALLIVPLLLLPVLWFSAPQWLSPLAEYILKQQCSDVIVDINKLGWNRSSIKQLHCRDNDSGLEFDVTAATIEYDIMELMSLSFQRITADTLEIKFHPSTETKIETPTNMPMPANLFRIIPASSIEIGKLSLLRLDRDGQQLQQLQGQASYSDKGLKVMLQEHAKTEGLRAEINIDMDNHIKADLFQAEAPLLQISASVQQSEERISIDGEADIELANLSDLLQQWLNAPPYQLQGTLHINGGFSLPAKPDAGNKALLQQISFHTKLGLDVALTVPGSESGSGKLDLDMVYSQGDGSWSIGKHSSVQWGDRKPITVGLSGLAGTFDLAEQGWSLAIAEKSAVAIQNLYLNDQLLAPIHITAISPLKFAPGSESGINIASNTALTLKLPKLRLQQNSLNKQAIKLTLNKGPLLSPSGSFTANRLRLSSPALQLPDSNLSGKFDLSAGRVTAKGRLNSRDNSLSLNWSVKHHPDKQLGTMDFTIKPLTFDNSDTSFMQLLNQQQEYAINKGSINGRGTIKWYAGAAKKQDKLLSTLHLTLSNLSGSYQTNLFSGLNGKLHFTGNERGISISPTTLTMESLHAEIPINEISMFARFSYPFNASARMQVQQLKAKALGGQISSDNIDIDFARASNPFLLRLQHMDAHQIAAIRQQEGLHAEGRLDGLLPFNWSDKGLKMEAGKLYSQASGGLIRYLGTEYVRTLAATDPATKMALDILSNFHFNLLQIGANYQPDGELAMSIELKGRNPGYEQGRPIEFNFNIQENLLKLLQSLRMTGQVTDSLEQKVQKNLPSR